MFDGIDELILPLPRLDPALHLYRDLMGFEVVLDREADACVAKLWNLPAPATRELLLAKPGASGGALRLVEVPGLPPATPAGRPDREGPYALDFYLRDAAAVEDRCIAGGAQFVSPAVHYSLPGTTIPVRERMLIQNESGLLHAFVQYRPRGTRCVLDQDPAQDTSEVAAAVFLTHRYAEARAFASEVLGGHEYFRGRFDGPGVEQMLKLSPGEGFEGALYRGPTSANARLEFGEVIAGGHRSSDPVPRVVARIAVDDLDRVAEALSGGEHGRVSGRYEIDGTPHLGLVSVYGATFDLFARA